MSDEFRIHHLASEITGTLKCTLKPDIIAQTFNESRTPYITAQVDTHSSLRHISERTQTPVEFTQTYDELKGKNVRILDGLTFIMEKITREQNLCNFLKAHAQNLGDAQKVPIGKPVSRQPVKIENMDLDQIQQNLTNSIKKPKAAGSTGIKLDQGDSAVSMETLMDVKSQQLRAEAEEKNGFKINLPVWWSREEMRRSKTGKKHSTTQIGALPTETQESELVKDVLSLLMGENGVYIWMNSSTISSLVIELPKYDVDQSVDISLKSLLADPIKIISALHIVRSFTTRRSVPEYGLVSHALAGELINYCWEINERITQLDTMHIQSGLNLQQLNCQLRTIIRQVQLISDLCLQISRSNARGASIMSILHERAENMAGDPNGQKLVYNLASAASKPYLEMVSNWIQAGKLNDEHDEFMITVRRELGKEKLQIEYHESYWEQHYSLVRERIPRFLEPFAEKILNTGKYLNVVSDCGVEIQQKQQPLCYIHNPRLLEAPINVCYEYSAKLLVDILLHKHHLIKRLRSVKRFFLLDQGDFLNQFIDLADEELKMPVSHITQSRLEALLEISIRTSAADKDPYKDDLRVVLSPTDLITQLMRIISIDSHDEAAVRRLNPTDHGLSGLEAVSFDYVVKWPLSLIISRKMIVPYQLLFRFLFYTKHVERILNNIWRASAELTKEYGVQSLYYKAAILRQRMLSFVLNLQAYVTNEVIEPHWHSFMKTLAQVQNIDEVLRAHKQFLESCMKDCHLSTKHIFKIIHKLLVIVSQFVNFVNQVHRQIEGKAEMKLTGEGCLEHLERTFGTHFNEQIDQHDDNFTNYMLKLIDELKALSTKETSDSVLNLVIKLDFNHYYAKMEKK